MVILLFLFLLLLSVGIQYLEAIRRLKLTNYEPKRPIHCLFVPDEEIGSARGMRQLVKLEEFKALNIGLVLDEGIRDEERLKVKSNFLLIQV